MMVAIDEETLTPAQKSLLQDKRRTEAIASSLTEYRDDPALGGGGEWDPNQAAMRAAAAGVVPTMDIMRILVEPNECRIDDALKFEVEFVLDGAILKPRWEFHYIVDYTNKRRKVPMTPVSSSDVETPYGLGEHKFTTEFETINVMELRKTLLLNVALLHCCLFDGDREVQQIALVTQVTKSPHDGTYQRNIFNPLKSVPSRDDKEAMAKHKASLSGQKEKVKKK